VEYALDDLQYKGLKILQPRNGYRSSEDSLILLNEVVNSLGSDFEGIGFEIGTGAGIIAILLAAKLPNIHITATEIQDLLTDLAIQNVKMNELEPRITVKKMDARKVPTTFLPNNFDFAYSNPPFYSRHSGRLSPIMEKQKATHEICCTIDDVLSIFTFVLKPGGRAFLIYPMIRWKEFQQRIRAVSKLTLIRTQFFKNLDVKLSEKEAQMDLYKTKFVAELIAQNTHIY
jgi:tRNA1Val (adenine37-N6)-methyltransferase